MQRKNKTQDRYCGSKSDWVEEKTWKRRTAVRDCRKRSGRRNYLLSYPVQ